MPEENASRQRVLIAEDDASMRDLLRRILVADGYEVITANDGLAAIARLDDSVDVVVTDVKMPGADGIQVLQHVRRRSPTTPVIVLTAFGSIPGAVDAMRLGAFDYLSKPLPDPETLREVVARALTSAPASDAAAPIAVDPAMRRVLEASRQVAPRDTTVLLLGESGTGKEVVAQLVHGESGRAGAPFVAVNCAALQETLLESELFGHERGSFTGATGRHQGRFEQANGGTLFLDEIAETSAALQAKLLRVLQERVIQRVGGEGEIPVDVRIIAATNRDLQDEVRAGRFREDLYYRIAVFPISIPPLRARPGDVLPLAQHFLRVLTRGPSRTVPELTDDARRRLQIYPWPGNVRELQNVMERSLVLGGGEPITAELLGLVDRPPSDEPAGEAGTLKEMEQRAIQAALEAEDGNRRRAAKRLGIALRTLQYKIKEYGLP